MATPGMRKFTKTRLLTVNISELNHSSTAIAEMMYHDYLF